MSAQRRVESVFSRIRSNRMSFYILFADYVEFMLHENLDKLQEWAV